MLADRYGTKAVIHAFGLCNILGLVLLIVGIKFPASAVENFSLYGAFILMGLGSTMGAMLTVGTGLLFKSDPKQQNRVISFLNALFDAGAIAYLGLWGLEKVASSNSSADASSSNTILILIIGGYLCMAVVSIGGYSYYFQIIESTINKCDSVDGEDMKHCGTDDKDTNEDNPIQKTTAFITTDDRNSSKSSNRSLKDDGDSPSLPTTDTIAGEATVDSIPEIKEFEQSPSLKEETDTTSDANDPSYIPIAMRSPGGQMKSKAYILLSIWFSFHKVSNIWTMTATRDFLGELGDDDYGNRYLSIFTLLTPFSIVALPFLDFVLHRYGFHAGLQAVNVLGILFGIIKVGTKSLNAQIAGFVVFTFFRCFLYSVGLSCVATFIGPTAIGKATGTLYVLAGLASFANIGLANVAVKVGFFIPNMVFLVGEIPLLYLTYEMGKALEKDKQALEARKTETKDPEQQALSVEANAGATTMEAAPAPSVGEDDAASTEMSC